MSKAALTARILGTAGIAAVTDNDGDGLAFFWLERPSKDMLRAITAQGISPGVDYDQDGAIGQAIPQVQFTCWGSTLGEAEAIAIALWTEMQIEKTVSGVRFGRATKPVEMDLPVHDPEGDGKVFGIMMRLNIPMKTA